MAKQCIYCGQPLPKDDARFCNDCGQSQVVSTAANAEAAPIKVKLPPKESGYDDSSPAPKAPFTSEQGSGALRPPRPSRLPKRPVRSAAQELQSQGEETEIASIKESINLSLSSAQEGQRDATPAETAQPTFEESTMVLPGWQDELALLRQGQERPAAKFSASPEKPVVAVPDPTPWRPQNVPPSMLAQERTPASADQTPHAAEERPRVEEPSQRELHVKIWDQQPSSASVAPPMPKRTSNSGSGFSLAAEERNEALADLETATWQSMDQQFIDQNATMVWEGDASQDEVEDRPTAVLNVPDQPQLTIERSSTPPSKSGVLAKTTETRDDVEDQPTRPMPASLAVPRPVTPLPASRPPLTQQNPSRLAPPAASEATGLGPSGSAGRNPRSYGGPVGSALNPPSPLPMPANPASQPGNPAHRLDARTEWQTGRPEQTPRSFAMAQPPNTPQPEPAYASTALEPPRKKRRGVIVAALLLLLLIGGGTFWYIQYQPFTNKLAQTDQTYQNTALGFSLHYPLFWKVSDNQSRSIVRFMDSSATGQVSLSRVAVGSLTLNQFLSQQVAQLSMTGQKPGPAVTFAGETWQQVQGSVNLGGATYTITLYVTQHSGHFYTLACLTLPNVYTQMEHDNFAPLRASFQFL